MSHTELIQLSKSVFNLRYIRKEFKVALQNSTSSSKKTVKDGGDLEEAPSFR